MSGILEGGWVALEEEGEEGEKKGLGQFTQMASCVPAVCQQNAEWRGERPISSHMHALSLAFHTPNAGPAKSGGQILLKPSLLLTHACGPLLHTPTHTLI